ncbi:MAG: hypothetical protein ACU0DB_09035 [Paracoccus sp. (in: a-proteobacteria)]|jgi:xanthosine utilization system XapX-like protein|uniref:hypothetical protein n=1 Tax=unclassified Paracoccus (in: a-proteobacteria) TaxID=2688777 RepID=UPI000C6B39F0|nr:MULTISPECIES: hypothetical protein [unclassified Paracoccus (in: a-proteobacteria)]MAN55828.1 hypothetical protein [Paracoccus sp. (in: a-proteobacteria)]MBA49895.1 hypothetical protein [Paracoccus sp. (in: a-proteobacteria)]MCS5602640.1 hypothetical protein [Paracoccus sp. (in: a-proteobacteria)]HIC66102.1 hypothetical protein [Paracoccus sp. (in: a-proteobacteria)]|tara:strand:- start:609 stop:842 length:234 start_codon:yes stop_codon:yes gene_type:complete
MSDYLLLAGVALGLVSILLAVVQLVQATPPRAAVITLILGIVAIFAAAYLNPEPFQAGDLARAWDRVATDAMTPPGK